MYTEIGKSTRTSTVLVIIKVGKSQKVLQFTMTLIFELAARVLYATRRYAASNNVAHYGQHPTKHDKVIERTDNYFFFTSRK